MQKCYLLSSTKIWNWETIPVNNESLSLVNTKFPTKLANCNPYFTALQDINNLETQRSYETTVNLENLKLKKKTVERFQNYSPICLSRPKC